MTAATKARLTPIETKAKTRQRICLFIQNAAIASLKLQRWRKSRQMPKSDGRKPKEIRRPAFTPLGGLLPADSDLGSRNSSGLRNSAFGILVHCEMDRPLPRS